jgi:ABC-type amino acid transport substrate-binding protein
MDLPVGDQARSRLENIRSSGWLRVGYSSDSLPWVFRNNHGKIVGYDMELMHRLARELDVGIETVLVDSSRIGHALDSNQIDIYASGLMIDTSKVSEFRFSEPYGEVTLGLLLEDHKREAFQTVRQLDDATDTRIAVLRSPSLLRAMEVISPGRELVWVDTPQKFLRGEMPEVDALIMPAEAASAWTLVYPQFSVVIPGPGSVSIPIVLALPNADESFTRFVDTWIQTAIPLGVMDEAYQHWILGRETATHQPRWSIIRDVLHWVD